MDEPQVWAPIRRSLDCTIVNFQKTPNSSWRLWENKKHLNLIQSRLTITFKINLMKSCSLVKTMLDIQFTGFGIVKKSRTAVFYLSNILCSNALFQSIKIVDIEIQQFLYLLWRQKQTKRCKHFISFTHFAFL